MTLPGIPEDIAAILLRHWSPAEAEMWVSLPHPQLDGRSARRAIADGQTEAVRAILRRLDDGAYL